jgi:2-succinyl-5-enolpyruvyl-6-hydroxy-3-cyclohexene-1-carboxylate synthase
VSGLGNERHLGVRADGLGHAGGDGGIADVLGSGYRKDWHGQPVQVLPPGFLRSGAGQLQAAGQGFGRVAPALRLEPGFGREAGEQRLVQPVLDEGLHSHLPDALGLSPIPLPPGDPLGSVLDAGSATDEDQAPDDLGMLQGHVEGHAGAHRVPQVDGGPGRLGDEPGRVVQVGSDLGRPAVARSVEPEDLTVPGQGPGHRAPTACGLGEPVDQHQPLVRRSRALVFAVEQHGERCYGRMTTQPQDVQATFSATLVDEWARAGVIDAVVCPGSRSTPLALALAEHPGLAVHVHQDERSGAFLALGLALGSGRPAVVLTTSGTAAVELHPGVAEAHHAGVPLVACTADRPPELRDVGAPQTVDQTHLYGRAVRWFHDPGVPDRATASRWRSLAARAVIEAAGPPPGPVHLNLPFREPLVGDPGPLPPARGEGPWLRVAEASPARSVLSLAQLAGRRGVILAGHPGPGPTEVAQLAEFLGWPVVADPRSSAWAPSPVAVAHLDGILRSEPARELLRPEVILRLGAPPASRVVNEWCAASGGEEIVAAGPGWSDPSATAALVLTESPAALIADLARQVHIPQPAPVLRAMTRTTRAGSESWLGLWLAASDAAAKVVASALSSLPSPNEPEVARDAVAGLPGSAALVVSSSMPIRDVERYAAPRADVRVLSNRGANGIDGVLSTAVGVALARRSSGHANGLLLGDLAFVHDSNGLLGVAERGIDLVCVVVDNDGGGIFSFLPQASRLAEERFETLFGTPHGLDLVALARAYGVQARAIDDGSEVAEAVRVAAEAGGVHVLVVRTDRTANVEAHRILDDAIATAVDREIAPEKRT